MQMKGIAIPDLKGKTYDQKIQALLECLVQQQKQIDFAMKNIGTDNMEKSVADVLNQAVGNPSGLNNTISNDAASSSIKQLAESIKLMVSKSGVIGAINLSAEEAKIAFSKIILEGYTTINNYFKVNLDGSIEAVNGKFSGELEAVTGTFADLTAGYWRYNSNGINYYNPDTGDYFSISVSTDAVSGLKVWSISCPAILQLLGGNSLQIPASVALTGITHELNVDGSFWLGNGTSTRVRVPKTVCGSVNVSASTAGAIDYSSAGFSAVPQVIVSYATTGSNISGDWGALKVYAKTASVCSVLAGGSAPSSAQPVDWVAIGY